MSLDGVAKFGTDITCDTTREVHGVSPLLNNGVLTLTTDVCRGSTIGTSYTSSTSRGGAGSSVGRIQSGEGH